MISTIQWLIRSVYVLAVSAGILSVIQYPGDKIIFAFFCLVLFGITGFATLCPKQYAHFFLGIMWFVGFWLKYGFHKITGVEYAEPYGFFDGSIASWDSVFLVISIGGAGYLAGRLIALPVVGPATRLLQRRPIKFPKCWPKYRNLVWVAAGLLVFAIFVANEGFGILVRGYVARVILPWPFGGLFAWLTDIGLALLLALFLVWDRQLGFTALRGFIALCIEGALFSISTLSRGIYFFHTVPPLMTESVKASKDKKRWLALIFAVWISFGVGIPAVTSAIRLFGYNALPMAKSELHTKRVIRPIGNQDLNSLSRLFIITTQVLLIDRWTGLEGVMAAVSYPEKGVTLLEEAATMRRGYGTVDVYTRKISGSSFDEEGAKTYHFATLAGPIAFFYFSGSLAIVFIGMMFLSILMSATELFWRWLVCDELLVAMSGLYLALVVMQFSGGVIQAATGVAAVTVALLAVWSFQLFAAAREIPKREADQYGTGN